MAYTLTYSLGIEGFKHGKYLLTVLWISSTDLELPSRKLLAWVDEIKDGIGGCCVTKILLNQSLCCK